MLEQKLKESFDSYPDFPIDGILFRDVLTVLREPNLFKDLIEEMSKIDAIIQADALVAIDARGFIFGTGIAVLLNKPMILARKPGKLPGELKEKSYELEYGKNSLSIQKESLEQFQTYVIVDDLLATGGTVRCVSDILQESGKDVLGLSVLIELSGLNAKSRFDFPVDSQISY